MSRVSARAAASPETRPAAISEDKRRASSLNTSA